MWLLFAISSSVCFGFRGILYQWTSQKPMDRNLMLLGVYFTGMLATLTAALLLNHQWSSGVLVGAVMGALSFISNGSMYKAYSVGKASVVAMLTGMPPVVVVTLAYILFNETLTVWQIAAFIFIMGGILMVRYSSELSVAQLKGIQWAVIALFAFAMTDTLSKYSAKLHADIMPTLFMMFATGTVLFTLFWLAARHKRRTRLRMLGGAAFSGETTNKKQWSSSTTFLWGMFVGTTNCSGMILFLFAMQTGLAGLVSAVVASSALMMVLYSRIFLKERFRPLELTGILSAISGVVLLQLLGN